MQPPQVVIDLGFTRLDVLRSLLPHEYDAFARDANLTPGQVLCACLGQGSSMQPLFSNFSPSQQGPARFVHMSLVMLVFFFHSCLLCLWPIDDRTQTLLGHKTPTPARDQTAERLGSDGSLCQDAGARLGEEVACREGGGRGEEGRPGVMISELALYFE